MKFFVNNFESYSEKSNLAKISFINTNTIIDNCSINIYVPKSVPLVSNSEVDIPYFIAEGIWTNYMSKHIKNLESQVQAKAPKGEKRKWKKQVANIFNQVHSLNEKEPEPEPTGNFIGIIGAKFYTEIIVDKSLFINDWTDNSHWTHNGSEWKHPSGTSVTWRFLDKEGNVFIYSTSSDKTNKKLYNFQKTKEQVFISCFILNHSIFRGQRQTKLSRVMIK